MLAMRRRERQAEVDGFSVSRSVSGCLAVWLSGCLRSLLAAGCWLLAAGWGDESTTSGALYRPYHVPVPRHLKDLRPEPISVRAGPERPTRPGLRYRTYRTERDSPESMTRPLSVELSLRRQPLPC